MKNFEEINLVALDATEMKEVQGGVINGCTLPLIVVYFISKITKVQ